MIKNLIRQVKEWVYNKSSITSNLVALTDGDTEEWQELRRDASIGIKNITRVDLLKVSQHLYLVNAYYRGLVRTYIKYLGGKRTYVSSSNPDWLLQWGQSFSAGFQLFFIELLREFFTSGEVFVFLPTMSLIKPENIKDATDVGNSLDGIIYGQNDEVLAYIVHSSDGSTHKVIPKKLIHHIVEPGYKRGIPYLLPAMIKCGQLNGWLNDRMQLNKLRSFYAVIRKHTSPTITPTDVKNFADAKAASTKVQTGNKRVTRLQSGALIDASNLDYQFLTPNVQAKDVSEDGRNIGLALSAMTGLPEFITRGDASNGSYSSTMVSEGPAEKEIELWQMFFLQHIKVLFEFSIGAKVVDPSEFSVSFPPIIARSAQEETKRNETLYKNKVISLKEWRRREQVDSDQMDEENKSNSDPKVDN